MKNVVIIGAGPAGITAAYDLLEKSSDYNVIILEESDEIGGISRTVCHNGNRMDIGGHRFFSKNEKVMQWWYKLMPLQSVPSIDDDILSREKDYAKEGPNPEVDDQVMLLRDRWSRIYYNNCFFDYPVKMNWNTLKNMGLIGTLRAGFSYLASVVHKLPEDNLENFYINRFGKVLYSMFFEGYTEKLWGRHPREISAEWGAQRVKGLSIKAIVVDIFSKVFSRKPREVETSLIEQFYYPKYGPGHLWETAAKETQKMGADIRLNSLVAEVEKSGNLVRSVTYVNDNKEYTINADYVFSTMPFKDLFIAMGDHVDLEHMKVAKGLPYRDFITVGLLVSKLNLKNETDYKTVNNIVPDCWIYVQDTSVKIGRIQIFNNWSPYMVKDFDSKVWIGLEYFCSEGDEYWEMGEEEFTSFGIEELIKIGIIDSESDVLDSHHERVKKAYPAYFDTYDEIDKLRNYIDDIDNLYCIGRNGQHRYNNMDHSMLTSFEAVDILLKERDDKDALWDINTEKEYHEEK